jgi:stress-induced morphogen
MFSEEKLREAVAQAFPGASVFVRDTTGTSDHFELVVVSDVFAGRSLLERHRMIYAALGDAVGGPIHALSIRAQTPAEQRQ